MTRVATRRTAATLALAILAARGYARRYMRRWPRAAVWAAALALFAALTSGVALCSRINNPIRLDVEFPRTATGIEPVVVVGRPPAQTNLVCARTLDDGLVELRYVTGAKTFVARPVTVEPGPHRLELRLPPLDSPRRISRPAAIHHDRTIATLDGWRLLDVEATHDSVDLRRFHAGTNPFADTRCGARFSGTVAVRPALAGGWIGFTQGYVSIARRFPVPMLACFVLSLLAAAGIVARAQPHPAAFLRELARRDGVPAAVCAFPLLLHLNLANSFEVDWMNHVWLIGYHGTHLARWLAPPEVIHTFEAIGLHHPVFYGHALYTLLSVPSIVAGPDVALRLGAFLILLAQFHECRRTVGSMAGRFVTDTIAILVCWTIYPLTNLYIRGAIPEFFAVGLLTCALCCLVRAPLQPSTRARDAALLRGVLYFGLAALTHPITGVLGGALVALVLVPIVAVSARRAALAGRLALAGVLLAGILSPWLYVAARFGSDLDIANTFRLRRIGGVDSTWVRLSPVPLDLRSVQRGTQSVDTPYLNAQINTPLLIVGVALAGASVSAIAARRRRPNATTAGPWHRYGRWLSACGLAVALIAMSLSVSAPLARMAAPVLGMAQFAYRFVTYVNLALIVFVCGRLLMQARRECPALTYACVSALSLAGAAVLLEQVQASATRATRSMWRSELELVRLPWTFYGVGDYTVRAGKSDAASRDRTRPIHVWLVPLAGERFARVQTARLHLTAPSTVQTNVLAFPWNRLIVNGIPIDAQAVRSANFRVRLDLGPGKHVIAYRFEPDATWRGLRLLSWTLIGGVGVGCLLLAARTRSADGTLHDEDARARADPASSAREPDIR